MTMRSISEDWQTLSPLLDEVLGLDGVERQPWLERLADSDPDRAAVIASLLEEQRLVEAGDFLGSSTAPWPFAGRAGQTVGGYTLMHPLGEGGMGSVWLARRSDGAFEGQAAVKFLAPGALSAAAASRFRREGSMLAQLTHPNIARLVDAGISPEGQPYLVLEYVDGERIDVYCRHRSLDIESRVRLFLDVLSAVAEAHRKLIVHRDIKPSNVFVRRDGVVKLIDFGVAKLLDADGAGSTGLREGDDPPSRDGGSAFTPEYAAPEQLRGGQVTTRTDVYALGVLLFELLTGVRPFPRAAKLAFAGSDGLEPPAPSRRVAADPALKRQLEGDLDNIVGKALRVVAAERYGSVDAFADDLQRYLANEPVTAHADTLSYRAGKFVRRHRGSVAVGAAMVAVLIGATVVTALQSLEADRQRDLARLQLRRAEAANDFVTSLLSQAGPGGRGLTPVELLDRGMASIRLRYAEDPMFAIDMLLMLSGRYMDLGHTDREYQALLDAEALARDIGDPATLLNVLCNTVETDVLAGRLAAAEARMQEARRLMSGLPDLDPIVEVNCLRQRAALIEPVDALAAIADLERAKRILETHDRVHGNIYSSLFSWLSAFNQEAGRQVAAHRYHEQDVALHARQARAQTVAARSARAALAASWYRLGEVQRAVAAYAAEAAAGSPLLDLHPTIPIYYGLAQSALGRHEPALALIEHGIAAATASGQQSVRRRGLYARAVALLRADRTGEAQASLDAYAAAVGSAGGAVPQSRLFALQAELHFANGRLAAAAAAAERALALLGHPGGSLGSLPAPVLTTRSRIRLAAGDTDAAQADARAALALLTADVVDPERSATVGEARLALAEALMREGRADAARRHARQAHRALAAGLGAEHPRSAFAAALVSPKGDTR